MSYVTNINEVKKNDTYVMINNDYEMMKFNTNVTDAINSDQNVSNK